MEEEEKKNKTKNQVIHTWYGNVMVLHQFSMKKGKVWIVGVAEDPENVS